METGISIVLTAIMKDETAVIAEMLDSMLLYINCYLICDTGSTDHSIEYVTNYMSKRGIPGSVKSIPWKNFGQARSEMMKLCHETQATYAFVMDCDDYLVGELPLQDLTKQCDHYQLKLKNNQLKYPRSQIFCLQNNNVWRYKGAVHEHAWTQKWNATCHLIEGNYHIEARCIGARNRDPSLKRQRDIAMLLEELQQEPFNTRDQFYLALTYMQDSDWKHAIEWFEKRLLIRHFPDEEWWSTLYLAECYEKIANLDKAKALYHQAMEKYPNRIEQAYMLSRLYEKENHHEEAWEIAQRGIVIPKPTSYVLWILDDVYDWKMKWQHFKMAYKAKQYQQVLSLVSLLDVDHFSHKKHSIHRMVQKSIQHCGMKEFTDYPLYVTPPSSLSWGSWLSNFVFRNWTCFS